MKFSAINREQFIQSLKSQIFDVLVIGGGITGAGIAHDAALRNMKTALVDMQDFAAGTSSRSTKLIHGGLRYLKQWEVGLVAEVGKEREIVYENGPHVTTPQWMLLPIYKDGTFGRFTTSIGLKIYDYLAGVKKGEQRKMLTPRAAVEKERLLNRKYLQGAGYYVEYRTDDARLTIEVMKSAVENGAICLNYVKADKLIYTNTNKISGVICVDTLTGAAFTIHAKKVVNAAGPWVDSIRELDGSLNGKSLQLTKGVHIVIDQKYFPLSQAVYFDTPDGRMIFAIPRNGKVYVGTTDTFYKHDPINPRMTVTDLDYLLNAIHDIFPSIHLNRDQVESNWAGVRPLILEKGKDPSEISRKDEVWVTNSGLITIAGGKLTGFRKMAEVVVDIIAEKLKNEEGLVFSRCKTRYYPISGGHVGGSKGFEKFLERSIQEGIAIGLSNDEASNLASIYGSNIGKIYKLISDAAAIQKNLPILVWAKLHYALEEEMIVTPLDFFIRRSGMMLFDLFSVKAFKTEVIRCMADYFQWDDDKVNQYNELLNNAIYEAVFPSEEE